MTDHAHTTLTPGCFRCGLNKGEIRGWADSLMVTGRGVVHEPDCRFVSHPCSSAVRWTAPERLPDDRACRLCLPDGLPDPAVIA